MFCNIKLFLARWRYRRRFHRAHRYLERSQLLIRKAAECDKLASDFELLGADGDSQRERKIAARLRGEAALLQSWARRLLPTTAKSETASVSTQRQHDASRGREGNRRRETAADFQVKHRTAAARVFGEDGHTPSFGLRSLRPKQNADHRYSFTFDQIDDLPQLACQLASYALKHLRLDDESRAKCERLLRHHAAFEKFKAARLQRRNSPHLVSRVRSTESAKTVNGAA